MFWVSGAIRARWYSSGCVSWTCMPSFLLEWVSLVLSASPSLLSSLTSDILGFVKAADTGNQPDRYVLASLVRRYFPTIEASKRNWTLFPSIEDPVQEDWSCTTGLCNVSRKPSRVSYTLLNPRDCESHNSSACVSSCKVDRIIGVIITVHARIGAIFLPFIPPCPGNFAHLSPCMEPWNSEWLRTYRTADTIAPWAYLLFLFAIRWVSATCIQQATGTAIDPPKRKQRNPYSSCMPVAEPIRVYTLWFAIWKRITQAPIFSNASITPIYTTWRPPVILRSFFAMCSC